MTVYRAEKQTDPDKQPGQIVNEVGHVKTFKTLAEYIKHIEEWDALMLKGERRSAIMREYQ